MALVVNDRVKETSTTAGTGTFTLDGAVTGFETFSSAIGNSNTTYYAIEIPNTTEFEVGLGTVAAGTLARTTVISSSNSDALVNFSAGTKNVFCTLPASKAVIEDASNDVTFNDKIILGVNKVIEFGDAGETISGDGTDLTISASSAMLIDVGTTLTLDGATQIALSDSGTNYGAFSTASNAFRMTSQISDNDLLFRGNDGGSFFTALTLDMSEAGAATFNDKVILGVNKRLELGDAGEYIYGDGSNLQFVSSNAVGFDAANGITLDGGSGGTILKAGGGTTYGSLVNSSGDLIIKSGTTTALTFSGANVTLPADLTVDTNTLHVDSSNNRVGIGTTSPSTLLHLSSSDPQITITDTDGTGSQVIKVAGDDLEFNVVGKTVIDSDSGGTLQLVDGGTSYLKFFEFGNYAALESMISDNDFKIRGNDGGSFFDALIFDMSDEGFAEFNSKIRVEADSSANAILVKGRSADDIGTIKFTANDGSGNQGELSARSSVFIFNTPTQTNFRINNTDKLTLTSSQVNLKDTVFVDVNEQIQFGDAGETISGDGTDLTIASSRHIKLDAANDITLDAGAGGVKFDDDGTTVGLLFNASGDLTFKTVQQDKDLNIKGNDGGSEITALTLDMSEAGDAIFNSNIFLGDNKKANFGAGNDLQIYHDGTQSIIEDAGTGQLKILAENTLYLGSATGSEKYIRALKNGIVELSYDNSVKLTTSSTGIDVTGTAVTDGLTVAGNVSVDGGTIKLDGNYPTGTNNVAMGDTALDSLTNGDDNTVIGDGAGTAVTTGQQNTVVGSTALNTGNATGNTAIGFRALRRATGANNTAIGRTAGDDTTTGAQNTFVGGSAGYYINGTNNVAVGYQAGNGLGNTGSSNVFMGYRAGNNNTTGSNNIVIGTSANASSATVSNEITLGDTNVTSLRIPGLQSGASSGDVLTFDGTDIGFATPSTGVSAGFAVAMAIAL